MYTENSIVSLKIYIFKSIIIVWERKKLNNIKLSIKTRESKKRVEHRKKGKKKEEEKHPTAIKRKKQYI